MNTFPLRNSFKLAKFRLDAGYAIRLRLYHSLNQLDVYLFEVFLLEGTDLTAFFVGVFEQDGVEFRQKHHVTELKFYLDELFLDLIFAVEARLNVDVLPVPVFHGSLLPFNLRLCQNHDHLSVGLEDLVCFLR